MRSRILIVALVAMAPMAWGVDVVRDGKPTAVICVSEDGGEQGRAAELSLTLRDGAGNNLPSQSTRIVPVPGRWTA